ncbi:MAG: Uncharacterized protein G01um101472_210 [Parcubacteria group bacterium Gr01-1014_72]|nr:MAG: Uncharacterized protein G01um101472_210 [Parcubacteria group bacterium Gr01-1014_72]
MTILLFLAVLAVLVFVHELGHFLAAKISGIRVDEFGLGFPPRLFSFRKGETVYSLNLIPFGGFVKILGEDPAELQSVPEEKLEQSITRKKRPVQALVLASGVLGNMALSWFLISIGFMVGYPAGVADVPEGASLSAPRIMVVGVLPDSPAGAAGLRTGDVIRGIADTRGDGVSAANLSPQVVQSFIAPRGGETLSLTYERGGAVGTLFVTPREGITEGGKSAIGVVMEEVVTLRLPLPRAVLEGARMTGRLTIAVAVGLATFALDAIRGVADVTQVAGPIGIAGLVGEASQLGIVYLLSFTAFISINLAVLNLLPFPALDGGRLFFLALEGIRRKPFNPRVMQAVNSVGFALLLLLMLAVTYQDIAKLL